MDGGGKEFGGGGGYVGRGGGRYNRRSVEGRVVSIKGDGDQDGGDRSGEANGVGGDNRDGNDRTDELGEGGGPDTRVILVGRLEEEAT